MFVTKDTASTVLLDNGVKRSILAHNDELMIVQFEFKKDQVGSLHSHPHTQSTYILSGKFEFTVGDQTYICQAGDTLIATTSIMHGCRCLEDGVLIDNFTPSRKDLL
ncbi:cupin domain-containing protein [Entomospira nematocerorum]|uniref:Cupin domain-containing protein n=1 Tax=Entomospira nematocerorum TaxID=2719987 RepID=A0A968KTS4_9SPIO|nr:cupin domain-containing protein [Entomospira nematocera]NIZ46504.1 cupin domain-containing protein [Entomospira nematocera]WDI33695.1 cupin domain-containing protein [Entomospira nematocera]